MNIFLEVNRITKDFIPAPSYRDLLSLKIKGRSITRALENVSFSLPKGKILAILGPNGAGKTTLLKILATLLLPDKGTVTVDGLELNKDDEKIKQLVGFLIDEERSFYWRLTGRQNLEFFAALYGFNKEATKARLNELFNLFKVDYAGKRFDSYSTGMRKRFALMRALIHNPKLLLLDEPTKSLDYASAHDLRNFIKQNLVKELGKTVIITTHQLDEALDIADWFMILNKGKMCAAGTLDELRNQIHNPKATLSEIFLLLA